MEAGIIIANFLYAVFGAILTLIFMLAGFKLFDRMTPFDTSKQLSDNNIAVGIVVGSIFIGLGIAVGLVNRHGAFVLLLRAKSQCPPSPHGCDTDQTIAHRIFFVTSCQVDLVSRPGISDVKMKVPKPGIKLGKHQLIGFQIDPALIEQVKDTCGMMNHQIKTGS